MEHEKPAAGPNAPSIGPLDEASLRGLVRLDRLVISDLLLRCIVGINPEERTHKQDIVINLALYADLSRSAQSDAIEDTVNYKTIKNEVVAMVESSSYFLVERLAARIAEICLSVPLVEAAWVRVEKPGALRFARSVGVELLRRRRAG